MLETLTANWWALALRVASHHWALLIEGAIGIIAGVLTFAWPAITAFALLYFDRGLGDPYGHL
jgi:uncharacterized membrane protein HdeD (DUF308 family)